MGRLLSFVRVWIASTTLFCPLQSPAARTGPPQPPADVAAVRTKLENFFAAYQREDLDGLLALWSARSPQLDDARRSFERTFSELDKITVSDLSLKDSVAGTGRASVRVTVRIEAVQHATQKPAALGKLNKAFELVSEGDAWKIWRYAAAEEDLGSKLTELKTRDERAALLDREAWLVNSALLEVLLNHAGAHIRQSRYAEALAAFDAAAQANERVGDQGRQGWIFLGVGTVHEHRAEYEPARKAFLRAMELAVAMGDKRMAAGAVNNLGLVAGSLGRLSEALGYYKEGLRLAEESGRRENIHVILYNIGRTYRRLGNQELALEYLQRSLDLSQQMGDASRALLPMGAIGNIHTEKGDYVRALEYHQRRLRQAMGLKEPLKISGAMMDIGSIHRAQGDGKLALDFYKRGLRISEEIGTRENTVRFLGNIGNVYRDQGDYDEAAEYHERNVKLSEELGDAGLIIGAYLYLGDTYAARGDYGRALEHHQKALSLTEKSGDETAACEIFDSLASDYLEMGEPAKALEHADRSAALARRSGFLSSLWSARNLAGRALLALREPAAARRAFLDSIEAVEKLRERVAGHLQARQRFFEQKTGPHEGMIRLSLADGQPEEAFAFAERAKGRALLDVFGGERVDITRDMTAAEREHDQTLTAEIASLNTELADMARRHDTEARRAAADVRARLERARLAYENFLTDLYASHPELKLRRGDVKSITAAEAAPLLDEKTAVFEYFVGESATYLFALTKAERAASDRPPVNVNVFTINVGREELGRLAEDFRRKVASRDLTVKKPAQRLYDLLVAPAEGLLRDKAELCIVPDGALWYLPFQALYRQGKGYLLERHAVYYAPSLSVLREMERKASARRAPPRPRSDSAAGHVKSSVAEPAVPATVLLAFGNPSLSGEAVAKTRGIYRGEELGPLPDAELEVKRLGAMYGPGRSKVLVGESAREEIVKAEAGHYRVLHFAAHAILDDQNPMYSRIMLSPSPGGGKEDGMLEAWEVMRLNLTADMAVLSGCETALGRVGTGEGMIGISWALFVAECPTVVASQWKVDSARTTQLMIGFHRHLLRGAGQQVTKAEALRQAALGLLRGPHNHPAYWAGFVLIGNGK